MLYAVVNASSNGELSPLRSRRYQIGAISNAPPAIVNSQVRVPATETFRSVLFTPPCSHSYHP